MRLQSLALVAMLCAVVVAREDTAELCSGALSCDAGYCCSSHGFCGRSPLHCSHSSGCNAEKGECGVVVQDKQDLPRVIPYSKLSETSMKDLLKSLTDDGSHVTPQDIKDKNTLESILQKGLDEKEKMLAAQKPVPAPAGGDKALVVPASDSNKLKDGLATAPDAASKQEKAKMNGAHSQNAMSASSAAVMVMGIVAWLAGSL